MKITGSIPRAQRLPSLRNVLMVDTVRGVLRVRKWPKKYGKPRSALQAWWIDWFRQANLLAKYADGMTQARAIKITKGSGLYPRDVMLKAMRGRLYVWVDENGWIWYPVAAIQDISESLDVLAQTVGSVLVRATDRWRAALEGSLGKVLTHQGTGLPPIWQTPGAGGLVTNELAESPITCDNTESEYVFDVSDYAAVEITYDPVNLASAQVCYMRYSTDGGVTYHSGGSDYRYIRLSASAETNNLQNLITIGDLSTSADQWASFRLNNLRAGRCIMTGMFAIAASVRWAMAIANFDGPITHVKVLNGSAVKFATGTIRAAGFLAV